jgi:hypothetical protein
MPRGSAVTCLGRPVDQAFRLRRQARAKLALSLGWPLLQKASGTIRRRKSTDKLTAIPRTRNVERFWQL